jgi:sugar phosphate isomerase/epimerase
MAIPVALQLYSVREESAKDFAGTLAKVAEMGYAGVEFVGYGGLSAGQLKGHMERLKLFPVGSHVSLEMLEKDLDGVIAYCVEIGNPYVVCPWAPIADLDSVKKFAVLFNSYGERLQAAGLEFCYHNHSHEFTTVNGRYALDLLFEETDPSLVEIEFDTCWIYSAGADPVKYVQKYGGRCPLVHVKDLKAPGTKETTEVGTGVVDIKGIVRQAEKSGVDWLIVEQDQSSLPALESVRLSFANLKKMQAG